jgi:hypothetical protein
MNYLLISVKDSDDRMSDFGIKFPNTIDGEELYDAFESMAEEGTEGPFSVHITDREIFDIEGLIQRFDDPEEYADLKRRQRNDKEELEKMNDSIFYAPSSPLESAEWFLESTKPGLNVEVRTKRMNSIKDFFFPLSTSFEIDPDDEYINLGEDTGRHYDESHINDFEPFAEELYEKLGYNPENHDELVIEDIPHSEESDYHLKGMRMGNSPGGNGGRRFLL